MAKLAIKPGSTDVTVYLFIQDSSVATGAGKTGLAHDTASLVCYYVRPLGNATQLSLVTQTVTGAHTDGGFVAVEGTNMPGVYRLDLSDAICAASARSVAVMLKGAADMAPVTLEIDLKSEVDVVAISSDTTAADNLELAVEDGPGYVRKNTAQTGAASTITLDASASALNDFYNGTLIFILSGTGANQARVITDYVGSTKVATVGEAWATTPDATSVFVILPSGNAISDVNLTMISGDQTAADNLEAALDGTGFNVGGGSIVAASVAGNVGGDVLGDVAGSVGSIAPRRANP